VDWFDVHVEELAAFTERALQLMNVKDIGVLVRVDAELAIWADLGLNICDRK
jgi:hypothetical protein